jgi:hypothetical protein
VHGGDKEGIRWSEIESAAPSIAERARQRLEATRVALLGTLRGDGSPRISPVEPYFSHGHLLFGAMAWSRRTGDLRADPRCPAQRDHGPGRRRTRSQALRTRDRGTDEIRNGCSAAWWQASPAATAVVFSLTVERATVVEWDLEQSQMFVRRWSPRDGLTESSRSYP